MSLKKGTVQIEGLDELIRKVKKMDKLAPAETEKSMKIIVDDLWSKSNNLVPVGETGDLAGSGHTEVGRNYRGKIEGLVEYTEPYAIRQHEELEWKHKPGKTAKYLENPFKENIYKYLRIINNGIAKAVRK